MEHAVSGQPVFMNFAFTAKKRKKQLRPQEAPPARASDRAFDNQSPQLSQSVLPSPCEDQASGDVMHSEAAIEHSCAKKRRALGTQHTDTAVVHQPQVAQDSTVEHRAKRFTLFVGNMPFNAEQSDVQRHFAPCGGLVSCRLLRNKDTGAAKGIAFVDFSDSKSYLAALKLHHSLMGTRRINVEPTAGGGGNSSQRKSKIESKKKRLEKIMKIGACSSSDEVRQTNAVTRRAPDHKSARKKKESQLR
jgi:nucleolar protein 6